MITFFFAFVLQAQVAKSTPAVSKVAGLDTVTCYANEQKLRNAARGKYRFLTPEEIEFPDKTKQKVRTDTCDRPSKGKKGVKLVVVTSSLSAPKGLRIQK